MAVFHEAHFCSWIMFYFCKRFLRDQSIEPQPIYSYDGYLTCRVSLIGLTTVSRNDLELSG